MSGKQLNATAASLLGFLHDGPRTGWDLVSIAQRSIGDFWSLTRSQVYRELTAMAGADLVRPGEPGRRDSRPYSLTRAGRKAFTEWIAHQPGEETIRFPLLLTVLFGRHLPASRLAEFLADHRARHAQKLAEYHRIHDAVDAAGNGATDAYALATLQFGLLYEQAVLDWFDQVTPTLTSREPSGRGDQPR